MQTRKRMTKLEVAGDDPYQVVSMYVEIDGKPCCLEMASRIDGDFMPDGYSREEILSSVRIHKEKIYIDPVKKLTRISDIRLEMMCFARLLVCFGMLQLAKAMCSDIPEMIL